MKHLLLVALLALFSCVAEAATLLPNGKQCFAANVGTTGMIGTSSIAAGGASYTSGTYSGVALTGGTGTGATATIVVAGGAVTTVTILNPGTAYVVGDLLSAAAANIGGTGAGFSLQVTSAAINNALVGGLVFMYIPATTTPKQTWQDAAQTILNSTPIVLDSNGCAIIYGIGTYRQVLQDSLGNTVWDQLTADTSTSNSAFWAGNAGGTPNAITVTDAGFNSTDGSIISFVATVTNTGPATLTASGGGGAIPINKATTTGPSSLAAGDIVNGNTIEVIYSATSNSFQLLNAIPAAAAAAIVTPQGRLTPTSGTPVIASDVSGASTIFYTAYTGPIIPIWNGTNYVNFTFSELTLTLSGSNLANTIYDVCVFANSGVPTVVTGPAWTNSAAGAGARGAGAGTTQLQRVNGLLVNAVQITGNNGASAFTIPANQCTYVGSLFIDSAAGQVSCFLSYGQSRKCGTWNAYNRVPIFLQAGDPTASWTYANATVRASNATAANVITVFSGLAEEIFDTRFSQKVTVDAVGNVTGEIQMGICYNVTNAFSGTPGYFKLNGIAGQTDSAGALSAGQFAAPPSLGINNVQACEATPTFSATNTLFGTEGFMKLTARWRG